MSRPIELRLCLAIVASMFDSVPRVFAQDGVLNQLPGNQANRQQFILAQESASITAETERIIVTGSNIPTAQEEPSLPVTRYTAEFLRKAGAGTPVEGLRQLPSFVGIAATENDSNGGSGAASINLRGIGDQNVVILINARRAFLGASFAVGDVNLIPISDLQRAEVLKDGASSIYGSDAVAGVVDFVMYGDRRLPPYEGAEFELRYGTTTDTDANVRQAWIRGGVTGLDGKVAIFAAAEYYNRAALFARDRTISVTGDLSNNHEINVNPDLGVAGLGLGGLNNNSPTFAGRVSAVTGVNPITGLPFLIVAFVLALVSLVRGKIFGGIFLIVLVFFAFPVSIMTMIADDEIPRRSRACDPAGTKESKQKARRGARRKVSGGKRSRRISEASSSPDLLPETIILRQSMSIQLPSGNVVLPAGTQMPLVARNGDTIQVRYMDAGYEIPLSATDLQ